MNNHFQFWFVIINMRSYGGVLSALDQKKYVLHESKKKLKTQLLFIHFAKQNQLQK